MSDLEAYLDDLAATGKYGQIPSMDGPTKPLKIVQMTPLENDGPKQFIIKALDEQGAEYIVKVGC